LTDKYAAQAEGWSERAYADSRKYLRRRATLIAHGLERGDTVLDLACGDGGVAEYLLPLGLRYVGVDANEAMVKAARARLGDRGRIELSDVNEFAPDGEVAATSIFRAIYYARDHDAFLRRVASYTRAKLVFDLNPRQYDADEMVARVRAAGFEDVELRPFFVPQRVALPFPLDHVARGAERVPPLARLALRYRFTYVVSAFKRAASSPAP
jgi:SAM-dependent methyltransferase